MTADEIAIEISRTQYGLRCLHEAEAAAKIVLVALYRARRMCGDLGEEMLPTYQSQSESTKHLQDYKFTPGAVDVIREIRQALEKVEDREERLIEQHRALARKPAVH